MTNKNLLITVCAVLFALVIIAVSLKYANKSDLVNNGAPNTELTPPTGEDKAISKNSSPPSQVQRGEILDPNMPKLEKPTMALDASKNYKAIVVTNKGVIKIDLAEKTAPNAVNNFVYLANNQFYNNIIFHRIIKGFMIQTGDPTGTGSGGPGYSFDDEPFEGEYVRGTVAMANAGPNTNGSQFFIMDADTPLPKNYTIFGNVEEGLDTVDAIAATPVSMGAMGENSQPTEKVYIESVEIVTE
jgi:cyclophilin family peptidyl-prolyl cis-trans isomerase